MQTRRRIAAIRFRSSSLLTLVQILSTHKNTIDQNASHVLQNPSRTNITERKKDLAFLPPMFSSRSRRCESIAGRGASPTSHSEHARVSDKTLFWSPKLNCIRPFVVPSLCQRGVRMRGRGRDSSTFGAAESTRPVPRHLGEKKVNKERITKRANKNKTLVPTQQNCNAKRARRDPKQTVPSSPDSSAHIHHHRRLRTWKTSFPSVGTDQKSCIVGRSVLFPSIPHLLFPPTHSLTTVPQYPPHSTLVRGVYSPTQVFNPFLLCY